MRLAVKSAELHQVFAAELLDRIAWFVRLRWAAGAALLAFAAAAPHAGMPLEWGRVWLVAVVILAYNGILHALLAIWRRNNQADYRWLARCTLIQILIDLAALVLLVYLTGGPGSPFLPFFTFHMVIGTIMLSARTMFIVGGGAWLACAALFLAGGTPPGHPPIPVEMRTAVLGMLACALGLTVYLTATVSSRLKERGVRLFRLAEELRDKTAELEKLLAEMRSIEARKSHFMLLSAHQLRSPLATVKTSLDVLLQGYVDLASPRAASLVAGASERVEGLLRIVGDLLELAKLRETAQRAPWASGVNLAQLAVDVADALTPVAEARQITLESSYDADVVLARGVPPDLEYAIENLVHNALKYSRPGGTVHIQVRRSGEFGMIEVRDNGIGIPPEFLANLFVEFARAANARRHTAEGTGLGLAIVNEVAETHGGRVEAESRLDEGSTFRLLLPLRGGQTQDPHVTKSERRVTA
ncbi:MAG TPA: HAMP domain-containing sensor histidine kinase [Thermoanaerobaculaceae bacterium]|nr:HAMP domain-containing sensor histidine kinase [Thermoanaerobaculaceae bacterium]